LCNGSLVAIDDYPELFGEIGNSFGPSAGVNFYLPNMLASTTSTFGFVNYIIKI
jgi:microcystin-dependent protein